MRGGALSNCHATAVIRRIDGPIRIPTRITDQVLSSTALDVAKAQIIPYFKIGGSNPGDVGNIRGAACYKLLDTTKRSDINGIGTIFQTSASRCSK